MTAPEKIFAWQWVMPYPSMHERKRSWHEDSFPDGQVATEYVRKDLFEAAERSRDEWRENFRSLEKAIVGDTGLSAMTVATQAKLFKPRAEAAEEKVAQVHAIANELSWDKKTRAIAERLAAALRDS